MQEIHALCQSAAAGMDMSKLLSSYATVRVHQEVGTLAESVQSISDAVVVVDFRREVRDAMEALRAIREWAPHFPIVGRVGLEYESFGMTVEALEFGMAGVWVAGIEDGPGAVQHVFDHVVARSIGAVLEPAVEGMGNATTRHFLRLCFHHVMQPVSVADLADRMGMNARSVARALNQSGLPRAERLLVAARMVVATRLLQNARRKVTGVAAAMGGRDVKVFRRQLSQWAGREFVQERNTLAYRKQLAQWQEWLRSPAGMRGKMGES
jgi:AraC-like DNA-binding protein